jgi:3-oxoacyl-(acyl-carrier-protein) synthase
VYKNIFISGIEAISPLGDSLDEIFLNLVTEKIYLDKKSNQIESFNFYKQGYHIKTRISSSGQLCVHVTAQLTLNNRQEINDKVGLITVSKYGCPKSRLAYWEQLKTLEEKQFASPKDFVQSISNIPNALATIECNINGFANHYVGSSDAALAAFWQGVKCIEDEIADEMLVTSFDTVTKEQIEVLERSGFQYKNFSDAASGLRILRKENSGNKNTIFEVLGFGFSASDKIHEAVENALLKALQDSDLLEKKINFIISNSNSIDEYNKNEKKGLKGIFKQPVPTLMLKSFLGESFAAYPFLCLGILSKMCKQFLPVNGLIEDNDEFLNYNNILIEQNSIFLLIAYDDSGNASAVCLKYS